MRQKLSSDEKLRQDLRKEIHDEIQKQMEYHDNMSNSFYDEVAGR